MAEKKKKKTSVKKYKTAQEFMADLDTYTNDKTITMGEHDDLCRSLVSTAVQVLSYVEKADIPLEFIADIIDPELLGWGLDIVDVTLSESRTGNKSRHVVLISTSGDGLESASISVDMFVALMDRNWDYIHEKARRSLKDKLNLDLDDYQARVEVMLQEIREKEELLQKIDTMEGKQALKALAQYMGEDC